MRIATLRLVLVLCMAGSALGQEAAREVPAAETAASPGFRDVIRLHEAGLSEEFILRKIGREKVVYRLSTDDIIACKGAGLPESIIEAMLKTAPAAEAPVTPEPPAAVVAVPVPAVGAPVVVRPEPVEVVPAPAEAPLPAAAPGVAAAPPVPAAPAVATPGVAAQADRSWEGIVRRAPGVVLFRSPWEEGVLSFREGTLRWADASDPARSFAVPATEILEQFLVCPKDADSDGACFEWGVKTASGEHRFRDAGWERSGSTKPRELFEFMQAIHPDLATERYRAKKK
ncbi:MAG: hypothetical protein KJ062_05070 [Thermoanaerobaculia bacterium]|nr:hypothetical protein [Thermoanaerobaculia bacterium]